MKYATIARFKSTHIVTLGAFYWHGDEQVSYYTVEKPDLNNMPFISCIPCGEYVVKKEDSPKYGPDMLTIQEVEGRTDILFHVANWPANVKGCVGMGTGVYPDLSGVSHSVDAINLFYAETKLEDEFSLTIINSVLRM
jgi:hypothetical protein